MTVMIVLLALLTAAVLLRELFKERPQADALILVKLRGDDETARQLLAYIRDEQAGGIYGRRIVLVCGGDIPDGRTAEIVKKYGITAADENTPIGKLMTKECALNE